MNTIDREERAARQEQRRRDDGEHRLAEQPQREDRLRGRRSCATNAPQQATRDGEADVASPRVLAPPSWSPAAAGERAGEQRGAEVVEPARLALGRQVQRGGDEGQRDDADRHVDVEPPAPARVIGEHAAQQRARRRWPARTSSGCSPGSGRARAGRRCRRRSPSPASSARRRRGPAARGRRSARPGSARRRSARSRRGRRRSRPEQALAAVEVATRPHSGIETVAASR